MAHLRDVIARFCPVEVRRVAGENDNAARGICLHLVPVKLIAQSDVENARHDCVDSVLGMFMRHELHARRDLHPDKIGPLLRRVANEHC